MKKILIIAICMITLCNIAAVATPYTFIVDSVCYKINGDEAMVTVYDDDPEKNYQYYKGKITIPETVTRNGRQYRVTSIGPRAFMRCHNVTELYLPDNLEVISDEAFKENNVGLEKMRIGPNVHTIGKDAFCITMIGDLDLDASNHYFVLEDGILYSSDHKRAITLIGERGKTDFDVNLHQNVQTVENGFACGRRLHSLHFGNSVKTIGYNAFYCSFYHNDCQNTLILPDCIEKVGHDAFYDCIGIDSLYLSDNLTRIEPFTFYFVTPTYIHMPKHLKVICDDAFMCNAGGVFQNLVLPEGLDSIGKYAFSGISCDSLIVPSSVRYLSEGSLDNLSRYVEIKAPLENIPAGCLPSQGAREIVLPKNTKRIEDRAFYPCYDLKKITWPDSLEYIGAYAFAGNQVKPLIVPSTVKTLGRYAFEDNIYQARTYYLTSQTPPNCLADNVFSGIIYKKSTLYVPKGCKDAYAATAPWSWFGTIDEYEDPIVIPVTHRYDFEKDGLYYNILSKEDRQCEVTYDLNFISDKNMYSYRNVVIPDSVTYDSVTYKVVQLGVGAFADTPLEKVTLPKTLVSISGAFQGCTNLTSIAIPENVVDISVAFKGCTKLRSVHVPDNVKYMGVAFAECSNLESVNIPESVTDIGSAFKNCESLKSVVIPDRITEIPEYTFMGCKSLSSVHLPANLKIIYELAFASCSSLKSIVLPAHTYIIKTGAFEDCYALTDITSLNTEPPYPVGYSQFAVNNGTLHVPAGCKAAYQSISMWQYFNIIEDASTDAIRQPMIDNTSTGADRAYDILGRPVNNTYKGIVIKNGKLMFKTTR